MSDSGGTRWRALPTTISPEELGPWCSRIPGPVAVTGATGFVGSHLVEALLAGGVRPRLLVREVSRLPARAREEAEVVQGDLDDHDALAALVAGCGAVIHVAGLLRGARASQFDRANRVGTENLVRALSEQAPAARLVHLSSMAAAGPSTDPLGRWPEDSPNPVSTYGRSKLAGEAAARRHRGVLVILRPPAIYGPRDTDILQFFRLVGRGVALIPAGERFLTVAFVADVVRAILAAVAGAGDGRTLCLGEPVPRTLRAMVAALADTGGVEARCLSVPQVLVRVTGLGGDLLQLLGMRRVPFTTDKAREMVACHWSARTGESLAALGLDGFVPFEAGATATWAWYRDQGWVPRAKIRARHRRDSDRW
jgi:nucleoside-diphosphate-sugar epimerase